MKKTAVIYAITISIIMLALTACSSTQIQNLKENPQQYAGKEVKVQGEVANTVKLGPVSGFTIKDSSGSISVSSKTLPAEGSKVTVKGTLVKDTLLGYYIIAEKIS